MGVQFQDGLERSDTASSGFVGVHPEKNGRYKATTPRGWGGTTGEQTHIGTFDTKEQAAHAYDQAAREHRTDAPLNFASAEAGAAAAEQAEAEDTLVGMATAVR